MAAKYYYIPLLVFLLYLPAQSFAQENWQTLAHQSNEMNKTGMKVLLGWSILNISTGIYGNYKAKGSAKYFHQMNAFWNVVNAGIAIGGLSGLENESFGSLQEAYKSGLEMEKLLLLNAGLDVGYIAAGGWLLEHGKRKSKPRFKGYGKSIMLQGGFLLVFDGVLFWLNNEQNSQLYELLKNLEVSAQGAGLTLTF